MEWGRLTITKIILFMTCMVPHFSYYHLSILIIKKKRRLLSVLYTPCVTGNKWTIVLFLGWVFFCIAMTIKLANWATYFKMTIISCTVTWGCSAENTNFCTGKVKGYRVVFHEVFQMLRLLHGNDGAWK